MSDILMLILV